MKPDITLKSVNAVLYCGKEFNRNDFLEALNDFNIKNYPHFMLDIIHIQEVDNGNISNKE
jgi:hypothetical protein